MAARRFFLFFALALVSSMGLLLFLDTRHVDWQAYRPRSARLDAAYPLGGSQWLLQLTVRSALSMAYTRSVVYDFATGTGHSLGTFEDQWYPLGFSDQTLWLLREKTYVASLRESQILTRMNAPSEVSSTLEIWQQGTPVPLRSHLVRENGIPFLCGGQLVTASYGNSDTMFYVLDPQDRTHEWFVLPEPFNELPFCGADGRVYMTMGDATFYTRETDGETVKRRGKLQGQLALNGLWVGVPLESDCVYVAPALSDQSAAGGLTSTTTLLLRGSPCAERMAAVGSVRAMSTQNQTDLYVADQPPQRYTGSLAGVGASGFVLEQPGQGLSWLSAGADGQWFASSVSHTDLFELFPPLPKQGQP